MFDLHLRAVILDWPDVPEGSLFLSMAGIALPDGRFIFHGGHVYSSEAQLLALNPGARLQWNEHADHVLNFEEDA